MEKKIYVDVELIDARKEDTPRKLILRANEFLMTFFS